MPEEPDPAEAFAKMLAALAHNTEILRREVLALKERVAKLEGERKVIIAQTMPEGRA